jgi:2-polyprenyl-6-methoxyphenol hydroxylase-like FAD-dependent oxidoreductase
VPQARQGHTFLALGTGLLRDHAPDVLDRVVHLGGSLVPLAHHPDECNLLARRLLFEAALGDSLRRQSGVRVVGETARGLEVRRPAGGVPMVVAVHTDTQCLDADLLVDATGRRSPTQRWLDQLDVDTPRPQHGGGGFLYVTRHYRLRPGAVFPATRVPIVAALDYATVLVFPEDGGRFQITLMVSAQDPCRRCLRSGPTFDRFVQEVPVSAPWLDRGVATSEPEIISGISNRRRRLDVDGRPCVAGLVLLGDAAVQTNPTAGRGISLAVNHARDLADLLDEDRPPVVLAEQFAARTSATLGSWLESQLVIDEDRRHQLQHALRGRPPPPIATTSGKLALALAELRDDEVVGAATDRLYNLLATPHEIVQDRAVMRRVVHHLRHGPRAAPEAVPDRPTFERMLAP